MPSTVSRAIICCIAVVATGEGALAQGTPPQVDPKTAPAVAPTLPAPPPKPFACERPNSPRQREAIAAAEALFDASWLTHAPAGRVTAFKTKPEAVNPFAIRDPKAEPPKPPISGYIRADRIQCEAREADGEMVIALFGSDVRFHENGKWSSPIRRGLLMVIGVRFVDGVAKADLKADAPTVVLPDAVLRKPEASEIPSLAQPKPDARAKKS